jgi:hypothetical protein
LGFCRLSIKRGGGACCWPLEFLLAPRPRELELGVNVRVDLALRSPEAVGILDAMDVLMKRNLTPAASIR